MLKLLLRLAATTGPEAMWIVIFIMGVVAVFVLYIGVAMAATLRAKDPDQGNICYKVFSDLVGLFGRRRRR
jgi:hypothetical protein